VTHATLVLVRGDHEVARWPLERWRRPDIDDIDELARLSLAARRLGCAIRIRDACPLLVELIDLAGLRDVLDD
jgi:hypothetical protein